MTRRYISLRDLSQSDLPHFEAEAAKRMERKPQSGWADRPTQTAKPKQRARDDAAKLTGASPRSHLSQSDLPPSGLVRCPTTGCDALVLPDGRFCFSCRRPQKPPPDGEDRLRRGRGLLAPPAPRADQIATSRRVQQSDKRRWR